MLHIDIPTLAEFKQLAQIRGEICVSLYLPTSPLGENARVNRVAFKDIAKEALSQLKEAGADKKDIVAFEARFEQLAGPEHDVQGEDKIRKPALPGERVGSAGHVGHDADVPPA